MRNSQTLPGFAPICAATVLLVAVQGVGVAAAEPPKNEDAKTQDRRRQAWRMQQYGIGLCKTFARSEEDRLFLEGTLGLLRYTTGPRAQRGYDPFADDAARRCYDYFQVAHLLQGLAHHSWRRLPEESPSEMLVRLQKKLDSGSDPEVMKLKEYETEFRAVSSDPWPVDWRKKRKFWLDLVELALLTKSGEGVKERWRRSTAAAVPEHQRLCRIAYLMAVRSSKGAKLDHEFVQPLLDDAELVTDRIFLQAEILRTLQILGAPQDDVGRSEARAALLKRLRKNPLDVNFEGTYELVQVLAEVYKLGDERLERGPLLKTLLHDSHPYVFSSFARRAHLSEAKVRKLFLSKRVTAEYDRAPVGSVVQELVSQVNLRVWIDEKVLAGELPVSILPIQSDWIKVMQSVLNQTPYRLHVLRPDLHWIGRPDDAQAASAMLAQSFAKIPPGRLKISEALQDDTRLEFVDTPLEDVGEFLSDQHGINILVLDRRDLPVTISLRGHQLHLALTRMLAPMDCDWWAGPESLAMGSRAMIGEFRELAGKHATRAARLAGTDTRTAKELCKDTRLEFPGNPVTDVAKCIKDFHDIEVTLAAGCKDLRVSCKIKGESLAWALDQVLFLVGLTWDTNGEQIFIGTEAQVGDFLNRAKSHPHPVKP